MKEAMIESLDRASLMIVATAPSGRIEYANAAATAFFGDLSEVDLSHPPLCDDPRSPLANLIGAWESLENRREVGGPQLIRVKAEGFSAFLWLHSLPTGATEDPGTLFLIVDLTAHVTGSEPVRRLLSQLAHDLRSPLTSISGAAELLLSGRVGSLTGVHEKLVKIVDDGASKMATIIQNASDEDGQGGAPA